MTSAGRDHTHVVALPTRAAPQAARRTVGFVAILLVAFVAFGPSSASADSASPFTTTVLAISPSVAGPGDTITLTATVTGTGGTPTGTVTFSPAAPGSTAIGGGSVPLAPVPGSSTTSQATLTTTAIAAGTYSIVASYASNDPFNFFGSDSPGVPLTVSSAVIYNTTTTLTSVPPSLANGQAATFTAVVAESGGTGVPTGYVTFDDRGNLLGTTALDATGQAQLTVAGFLSGAHVINASYSGDGSNRSSSATLNVSVAPGPSPAVQTTTTVTVSPSRVVAGRPVTISAHVVQTGTATTPPGGPLVTFTSNTTWVGEAPLDAGGNATVTVPGWIAGTYVIQASYVGDIGNRASAGNVSLSVVASSTPLTVTAPSATLRYGGALPTTLNPTYAGFVNGDTAASLDARATCTTTATVASPAGVYPVTCAGAAGSIYAIDYVAGSITITKAPLTVTAVNASVVVGQAIPTFTTTIAGFVNGQTLATSDVTGTAACTTTATASSPAGSYPITCTIGTLASTNYSFSFTGGTLTVNAVTSSCTTTRGIADLGSQRGPACEVLLFPLVGGTTVHAGDTLSVLYTDETPLAGGSTGPTATINGQPVAVTVTPILGRYIALLKFTVPSTLAPGTYTILLTAHDSNGHSDLVSWPVTVVRSPSSGRH